MRESWSRKPWSFFTAPMSRGNNESAEESKSKISSHFRASCCIRHKGQRSAWEEGDGARGKRRRDAKDGEVEKQESSGEERHGRFLGHEYESEAARKAGASHCHGELPLVTAVAAGGEPTERDGPTEPARRQLSTGRT